MILFALFLLNQALGFAWTGGVGPEMSLGSSLQQGQAASYGCAAGFQPKLDYDAGLSPFTTTILRDTLAVLQASLVYDSDPVFTIKTVGSPRGTRRNRAVDPKV